MKKLILFCACLCANFLSWGQYEKDYQPITFQGKIPAEFLSKTHDNIKRDLKKKDGNLDDREKEAFYSVANLSISRLLLSGEVYFNDAISTYVNQVASKLLQQHPQLQNTVKFYVTKSATPNAYALGSGDILINIGLLSRLENEAQLAFVLAHEIAHYTKKHSLLSFKKNEELKNKTGKEKRESRKAKRKAKRAATLENTINNDVFERLRYSREHEYEADLLGFELLQKSPYKYSEAIGALALLKGVSTHKYDTLMDMSSFLKVRAISDDSVSNCLDRYKEAVDKAQEENEKYKDEKWSSHPDLDKRIAVIEEKVSANTSQGALFLLDEERFKKIRLQCDFEIVAQYANSPAYILALGRAWQLQQSFPENIYLKSVIAQSLYWVVYGKSKEGGSFFDIGLSDDSSLVPCQCQIVKTDGKEMETAVVQYLAELYDKHPDNPKICLAYAKMVEVTEGSGKAAPIYKAYTEKFPEGEHEPYAQKKR